MYILTEYCNGGTLGDIIKVRKGCMDVTSSLTEDELKMIFRQILAGLKEMAEVGMAHGNLSEKSILVNYKNEELRFGETL